MAPNALTTSTSPKFTLFRDVGVSRLGAPESWALAPSPPAPHCSPFSSPLPVLVCTIHFRGGRQPPALLEERRGFRQGTQKRRHWRDPSSGHAGLGLLSDHISSSPACQGLGSGDLEAQSLPSRARRPLTSSSGAQSRAWKVYSAGNQ